MNVLLSIKPKYVDKIVSGNKKYEFRKSIFRCSEDIDVVYIYSTSPVKKIVGMFTIENIIKDRPNNLWNKLKKYSGVEEEDFFNYFKNHNIGFAIEIENMELFEKPFDPFQEIPSFKAPQSYYYIDEQYFDKCNETNSIYSKQ